MSERKNDGGPAFPVPMIPFDKDGGYTEVASIGMSLRDSFAGMVLQGMISRLSDGVRPSDIHVMCRDCFGIADAMLKAREQ